MSDEDPKPLRTSGETPAELVRALRALRRDDRDAARLARVAERLGTTIAASGAATGWSRWLTGSKGGLSSLVLGLGVLAVIGALGYALLSGKAGTTAVPVATPPVALELPELPAPLPAPLPATLRETEAAPPADGAARPTRASKSPSLEQTPTTQATRRPLSTPRAVRALAPDSATVTAPWVEAPAPLVAPEPAQARALPEPAEAKPTAQLPALPARPSEAALLHDARKLATKSPEAALRVLSEHAEWFPSGVLVPEREVLTIEVLRRLGRHADAERRLRQFEARYPQSIHLRRLERATSDDR